ncbi:hypothetical protein [Nonomuraea basaltis]|uniref:hypothetical protein n=1 Tax=Nonomuraea basaltis TaxID=2495887 RepID=UPI00110C6808|nr:hypothetical protein [Nonomuraea basaltis]TMS00360.1 hypothetical protein EJK15_03045 [Nonomuraea basaltis]
METTFLPDDPRSALISAAENAELLEFAFAEARLRGARLRAVHARTYPRPVRFDPTEVDGVRVLKDTLATLGERYPEVTAGQDVELAKCI